MYSETKKNIENSAMATSSPTTLAPVSVRLRKIPNDTSGLGERSSIAMNAPIRASATRISEIVWVEPQPALTVSTSA